jgi:hypothetical protein
MAFSNINIDPNEVLALVPGASLAQVNSAIGTALVLLDQAFRSVSIDYGLLREIALYVAAHITYVASDGASYGQYPVKSEKVMDASISYAVPDQETMGKSLKSTRLGAIALMLDITGKLQSLGAPATMFEAI